MNLMRTLRATSITEGCSFLILLFIAMPLKHLGGIDMAVKIVGWAHGVLFIALYSLLLAALLHARLPFKTAALTGIAALLPAGPFFADRKLREHENSLTQAP
ncbi:MAG: DUF3817 domain-containing protein [Verrucomicrobiales bacterium]|nr:DUF3817 domain-containing protein [Verrucomicrobiota bacterium JB025]